MKIEVFEDDEWADRVADRWMSHMSNNGDSRICLPTGETPRPVYSRSAQDIDLASATIFLLDEFVLPEGDPGRCDSMIQRDLLDSLTRTPKMFHRLDVNTGDFDTECDRYDRLIADGGLDLTLLGLGGNGHLGFNEPGSTADSPTRAVPLDPATVKAAARYGPSAKPAEGLTTGMSQILASHEIWLLVTGTRKADILRKMLQGPVTSDLPASYLRDHDGTTVFVDRSAMTHL